MTLTKLIDWCVQRGLCGVEVGAERMLAAPRPVSRCLYLLGLFDRRTDDASPLRPGAVVVADVRVSQQVGENEPGVGGTLADATIGNDLFIRGGAEIGSFLSASLAGTTPGLYNDGRQRAVGASEGVCPWPNKT